MVRSRRACGRLDECAALAVGEEFAETAAPGWALCHTVSACADVGDFGRAAQWCRALHTWSAVWQARHFFGVCRTAYGEVLATGGDWPSAEQELLSAMDDLRTTRPALAAPTAVRLGRLRVRQGDLAEARTLFEAALPLPQAILALGELDLAGGDATAAADAADRRSAAAGRRERPRPFPGAGAARARSRRRRATGTARRAAAERWSARRRGSPRPTCAGAAVWCARDVLSAAGDHDGARQAAEDAADLFAACSAPYEAAEARLLLSAALEALGRPERAEAEARAAREAFALLGAQGGRASGAPATSSARARSTSCASSRRG